ncbi:hypothetical protein AB0M39_20465 [Streptomyces sp. NPDC051907]|uniref:hypothetical protein n=1 Tax=Streptomyces sp. NPDC051907 TaxID=3155284 RepID=UPI00342F4891
MNDRGPLLGQRSAVVFLLGILTALGAGLLTFHKGGATADAVLVGGASFAAAVAFFHTIIE